MSAALAIQLWGVAGRKELLLHHCCYPVRHRKYSRIAVAVAAAAAAAAVVVVRVVKTMRLVLVEEPLLKL